MLSAKKQLEIANICYANVIGYFVDYDLLHKRSQANIDWNSFPDKMARWSQNWMWLHGVKGNRSRIIETAEKYAREIANEILTRAELLTNKRTDDVNHV